MPRDFWDARMRTNTGHEGELDLERTSIDGRTREETTGGEDDETSESSRYVHDTRGSSLYVSGESSGLGLGYNSVDFNKLAIHMSSISYIENKLRYAQMSDAEKQYRYRTQKEKRAARTEEDMRLDSINRKSKPIYQGLVAERDKGWEFGDPEQIKLRDQIDSAAAFELASIWRMDEDVRKLDAMVVSYSAWLEDVDKKIIRQRFRRDQSHKERAEFVYVTDALATAVVMPGGFDVEELMSQTGDELELRMITPRTDRERRVWIIEQASDYYQSGALYPPYVWQSLEPLLEDVVDILEEAGIDLYD